MSNLNHSFGAPCITHYNSMSNIHFRRNPWKLRFNFRFAKKNEEEMNWIGSDSYCWKMNERKKPAAININLKPTYLNELSNFVRHHWNQLLDFMKFPNTAAVDTYNFFSASISIFFCVSCEFLFVYNQLFIWWPMHTTNTGMKWGKFNTDNNKIKWDLI